MKLTRTGIKLMVDDIRREVARILPDAVPLECSCLYHAVAGMSVLRSHGMKPVLQAGTMSWPVMTKAQDDGTRDTHFSWEFNPDCIRGNQPPEMHVWLVLRNGSDPVFIDTTTCYLPVATKALGMDWMGPKPPEFLWSPLSELKKYLKTTYGLSAEYKADASAIMLAEWYIQNLKVR